MDSVLDLVAKLLTRLVGATGFEPVFPCNTLDIAETVLYGQWVKSSRKNQGLRCLAKLLPVASCFV
jgi:hypothetical protein